MSQNAVTVTAHRMIRCGIGSESYCLDLSSVQSIQRAELMEKNLEKTGPLGWLPAKDQSPIPVYSMAIQLGHPPRKEWVGPILVLNTGDNQWALMVDRLMGIQSISADTIFALPKIVRHSTVNLFEGVVSVEQELVLYLNPGQLHPDASKNQTVPPESPSHRLSPAMKLQTQPNLSSKEKEKKGQILLFSIGTESSSRQRITFGFSLTQVSEILERPRMTPIPRSPRHLLGLVNWRNQPVPVVDLGRHFGLGASTFEENNRLLIVRASADGELIGIPVRSNVKVQGLPLPFQPSNHELPLDRSLAKGVFTFRNETLVIPDLQFFSV